MRPARSTAVASIITSPAPDTASEPRCCMCQSVALPSSALYWHIGDTTMRLASVRSRNPMVVKSELGMDLPCRRARHIIVPLALPATAAMAAAATRNVALARSVSQHLERRTRHRRPCRFEAALSGNAPPAAWRKRVQAGQTQGSRPPRGLSGRRGRAANRITADVAHRAKLNRCHFQAHDDDGNKPATRRPRGRLALDLTRWRAGEHLRLAPGAQGA